MSTGVTYARGFRAAGIEIETPLRGRFNVENVLGAVAAGLLLDLDEDAMAIGIKARRRSHVA